MKYRTNNSLHGDAFYVEVDEGLKCISAKQVVAELNKLEAENARLKAELNAWVKGDRWLDNGDVMATTPLGALEAE
jgi:hypothetical protein